jgi:release factor glutamine methyltransferase
LGLIKKILNGFHPVLKPLVGWYLAVPRFYSYKGIRLKILPGVFHPGLFFSTHVLLRYLTQQNLVAKHVLELGAGSGLISLYLSKQGVRVTASDVSATALQGLRENALANKTVVQIVESDLFDALDVTHFDLIAINPPYYPKAIVSEQDMPWFCGSNFEYFEKLFRQLRYITPRHNVLMILSEDCNLSRINSIAYENVLELTPVHKERVWGEWNFIYQIKRIK